MCSESQTPSYDFKKRFQRLADSDLNSDCEFIVGPQKTLIKGHKVIFGTASEVFQAMFFGNLREEKPVRIEDLDPDGFRGMKTFIYTGEVSFTSTCHALFTFIAARKYMITDLKVECEKYIKNQIQPSDVIEILNCCVANDIPEVGELCCKIIQEKTDEVLASEYFVSASIGIIEFILKSPSLELSSEMELFGHFERWALAQVERQKIPANRVSTHFNKLKKHIRFLTISADEFVSKIEPSPLLTQEEKYAIALNKLKFNLKLNLESISMTNESRNFNNISPISKKSYQYTNLMFKIDNNGSRPTVRNLVVTAQNTSEKVKIMTVQSLVHDEYISFKARPVMEGKKLMIIKTKFKVLAVNQCDDIFFENESRYTPNENDSTVGLSQGNVVLAVIPKSILKDERFYRNGDENTIDVEGTFSVDVLDL